MKFLVSLIVILSLSKLVYSQDYFDYRNSFDNLPNDTLLVIGNETNNIWQIGNPQKPFFYGDDYRNPPGIMTDKLNNYPINNYSSFEIAFEGLFHFFYHNFTISFHHKYQTTSRMDGGFIEISYDNGNNWLNIINDTSIFDYGEFSSTSNFYSTEDTIFDGTPAFTGQSDSWINSQVNWTWSNFEYPWLDEDGVRIKIRFVFKSDSEIENKAGWIVDNIWLAYSPASAIDEINEDYSIIYPNPTNGMILVDQTGSKQQIKTINIVSASGKMVDFKKQLIDKNLIQLDISNLHSGLYIIQITYLSGTKSFKIIKQ